MKCQQCNAVPVAHLVQPLNWTQGHAPLPYQSWCACGTLHSMVQCACGTLHSMVQCEGVVIVRCKTTVGGGPGEGGREKGRNGMHSLLVTLCLSFVEYAIIVIILHLK